MMVKTVGDVIAYNQLLNLINVTSAPSGAAFIQRAWLTPPDLETFAGRGGRKTSVWRNITLLYPGDLRLKAVF